MHCLITAGPTREHIDPVRYISNASSGKMGYALASAAAARGWTVDVVSGPVLLAPPVGVAVQRVVSAAEMLAACEARFPKCDIFIAVAAVADYQPKQSSPQKVKKSTAPMTLELVPTPDILKTMSARKKPGQIVVGFAAETENIEEYAQRKLKEKALDWIVANDVRHGVGTDDNTVILLGATGQRHAFGPAAKTAAAEFILGHVAPAR